MYMIAEVSQYVAVASFAEAWIEIYNPQVTVRGQDVVASFAEAWIEIFPTSPPWICGTGRLLRGGVD